METEILKTSLKHSSLGPFIKNIFPDELVYSMGEINSYKDVIRDGLFKTTFHNFGTFF